MFTSEYESYNDVDHLVLNEGEITIPAFLDDLKNGHPKHLYTSKEWVNLCKTPIPEWSLIDVKKVCVLKHPVFPRLPVQL